MHYLFYHVRPEDVFRVKFILEAYENMMAVSTIDAKLAKIQIAVAPDFLSDAAAIITDLKKSISLDEIPDDPNTSQGKY